MELPRSRWPDYIEKHADVVKNIHIGRCPDPYTLFPSPEEPTEIAHAHIDTPENEGFVGTICLINSYCMVEMLLLHEIAHLISNSDHNGKWRRTLLKIGGTLDEFVIPGMPNYAKCYFKILRRASVMRRMRRACPPPKGMVNVYRAVGR